MCIFGPVYSQYYDLLYSEKNYHGDIDYIEDLIRKYNHEVKSILDLGCGTGRHASILENKGYNVHGVDLSMEMIEVAKAKNPKVNFSQGDIRTIRLDRRFEVVISLFHVMCYQTSYEDLKNAIETAYHHLNCGGLFIFDTWYGPAVLTDRPTKRVKRFSNEKLELTRFAEPTINANENVVDVNYHLHIKDKSIGSVTQLRETHHIRYLFKPEVTWMLSKAGFELLGAWEFGSGNDPGIYTWNVCYVGRKI